MSVKAAKRIRRTQCMEAEKSMKAIAIDDEQEMLERLLNAVKASPDISLVRGFSSCASALRWIEDNAVDLVFTDICMDGMNGLELAGRIREIHPDCKIIFCTGFTRYAMDAIQMRCSGYLLKPITAEAVQGEIDHIKGNRKQEKILTVKCFGNFEVYSKGKVVSFGRTKSKELLAILVDRNGVGITGREICAIMWPESTDDSRNMNYLHQLFASLRSGLEKVGAGGLIWQSEYRYMLDIERIDCDYYEFLRCGKPKFMGEYMTQYSWAEGTCAFLWRK